MFRRKQTHVSAVMVHWLFYFFFFFDQKIVSHSKFFKNDLHMENIYIYNAFI